ncbi:MAG: polyphosphate kinase 2 family protein [Candidatus Omnitrophica bacterium]|nr:polyphosphate kinase 2 family protein [Candidatus Omnitrophota bacterium]
MERITVKAFKETADKKYLVRKDSGIDLAEWDPDGKSILGITKEEEAGFSLKLHKELWDLQGLLYAEHKRKVLIVVQAMDTAGKDGVIQHVFKGVNPEGVKVASFKAPSQEELDHDFLWRVHQKVPAKGEVVIFNRSHYEDVLITRVHKMISHDVWKRRFREIREFEEMLAAEGTLILKFFLHISKKEQKERLEARIKDPHKNWKFSANDLAERKLWPKYMNAYEDALGNTNASWAPWYIIPSNRKWYRNLLVLAIIVNQLQKLPMKYPVQKQNLKKVVIQ